MPDDRLFHPRLLQSDKVDRLTDFERGVWLVSRLVCDDFGVMRASPNALQSAARFLERKPAKLLQRALEALENVGLLNSFDHEGRLYLFQWDWQNWQKVSYPRGTLHPKPPALLLGLCSRETQELFTKHPGGWGRKKSETLAAGSAPVPEPLPERLENVSPKPLAVSRMPLAVSRQPLSAAPDARSKRPVYTSDRLTVFEWQFEELSKMLGPHFEGFELDSFFDALTQQSRKDGLVIPKSEAWEWLQAQVLAEVKRRKLPIASAVPTPRDKAAENRAMDERILAEIQEARRAGR